MISNVWRSATAFAPRSPAEVRLTRPCPSCPGTARTGHAGVRTGGPGRRRGSVTVMEPFDEEPLDEEFHRNRREHGGEIDRLDDDKLARLTEEERVDAGIDDYNPDEVPPATDPLPEGVPPLPADIRETPEYAAERAEARRQQEEGELRVLSDQDPFPPTRYDDA